MARNVTFNLVVAGGSATSFDSFPLADDDLPRVGGVAGGHTPTYLQVDQYGRVSGVSDATPLTIVCDADGHSGAVVQAHSATQSAALFECQDATHGSSDQFAFRVLADGTVNVPDRKSIYFNKSNLDQPSIRHTGNGQIDITSIDSGGFQLRLTGTDFFWNSDVFNLGANYEYRMTCGTTAAGVAALSFDQRPNKVKWRINPTFDHEYWEQSSTDTRVVGSLKRSWVTSTDATRAGRLTLGTYYTSTFQEGVRIDSGATVWTVYLANATASFSSDGSASFAAGAAQVLGDGSLRLASIADASAASDSWFLSATSGKASYKDSGGTVHALY